MNWTLIVFYLATGGSTHIGGNFTQEFKSRELCVTAKAYYDNPATQKRMFKSLDLYNYRDASVDAQCFQTSY